MEWKFNGITIEVRCPRCGRWGRLLSRGKRNRAGFPRLMVMHNSTRNTFTESCSFGFFSEHYEELFSIYRKCRNIRET